ncbi:DUF2628 domain-containing protein [Muricoccus vinaceus]|uniref:DUF2628 domain-containing protein n=1 Tax=Muricoccus vinaceus TaxID=424704 RepID=A0ABV6J018_9PROT
MRVFTVHARAGTEAATRLVREGFSLGALLFGPLWLLWHGLWLALLGYVLLAVALAFLPDLWEGWAVLALQVLLGWHAHDLRRWTLGRRGFATRGVVVGRDEEEALLRLISTCPALARGTMA